MFCLGNDDILSYYCNIEGNAAQREPTSCLPPPPPSFRTHTTPQTSHNDSFVRPLPQPPSMAHLHHRQPTKAHDGQQKSTQTSEGQRGPTKANEDPRRPMTANGGPQRSMLANGHTLDIYGWLGMAGRAQTTRHVVWARYVLFSFVLLFTKSLTQAYNDQRRAVAGQQRLTQAYNDQQRPSQANNDQRRPTTTNTGQRDRQEPTRANEGQQGSMGVYDSQRPTTYVIIS
jgi:hypothetical protein